MLSLIDSVRHLRTDLSVYLLLLILGVGSKKFIDRRLGCHYSISTCSGTEAADALLASYAQPSNSLVQTQAPSHGHPGHMGWPVVYPRDAPF